jgi:hypothetical protein
MFVFEWWCEWEEYQDMEMTARKENGTKAREQSVLLFQERE